MSAPAAAPWATVDLARRPRLGWALHDAVAITGRNLRGALRTPQVVVFSTIQPIIFVLNFRYVFGGALAKSLPPGTDYVDYLMPGIFVQTISFSAVQSAIAVADDINAGLIERFRSLPFSRSAVLAGRTLADLVRNVFIVALMFGVGVAVGFRPGSSAGLAATFGLLLLFMFALSWVFATVGLMVADPEAAQAASFPLVAVLVFASSAFVPVSTMPGWLQGYARHQPVSVMADATRALLAGQGLGTEVLTAVLWCVGLVAAFAPLAVWRYRRTT